MLSSPTQLLDPSTGDSLRLFPEVCRVFSFLRHHAIPIGIASSSSASDIAHRLLRVYSLAPMVSHAVVRPGRKQPHLRELANKFSVPCHKMLFFDDLTHNIRDAEMLGCTAIHVVGGMTMEELASGLKRFAERRRGSSFMSSWLTSCPAREHTSAISKESVVDQHRSAGTDEQETYLRWNEETVLAAAFQSNDGSTKRRRKDS